MRNGPIPLGVHAMLEVPVALLLIVAPFLFGFSDDGTATAVSIGAGVAVLLVAMTTNWRLSLVNVIPLPVHAMIDIALGILLIAAPFLFGYSDESAPTIFHVLLGIGAILGSLATRWSHSEDVGTEDRSGRNRRIDRASQDDEDGDDPARARAQRQQERDERAAESAQSRPGETAGRA